MASLPTFKRDLISTCLAHRILTFGTFTLKSGRQSPYFFNAGLFNTSSLLSSLSTAYAHTITSSFSPDQFDLLFGPAYKGIPLSAITCVALSSVSAGYGDIGYAFNRKEAKAHGEGGTIVGADLKGKRIVIIDDVITAGTAIREAVEIIRAQGGKVVGIVVALDRQEKVASETEKQGGEDDGSERPSTVEMVRRDVGVPVLAVLTLGDLIEGAKAQSGVSEADVKRMEEYRARYGAKDA
ncbi:orotate phosphoribosyltransferase [Myriangium duriaei CBS 260.36]|uniref:Orotate phosphoribosyltransferase n=1 Tax=Myriangium duriaei CBS 260.36 TaxID=1168546 RepID=A0A9P4J7W1_9PEZI|nr:orotate phosphoribosyltransferase [Myriangium duriaei CBS 260.36]